MPSKNVLNAKKEIVASLVKEFASAKTIVLAEYRGLTVAQDTAMRANFRKAGVHYKIVKNTLSARAMKDAGIEGLDEMLKGPIAIAYSTDDVVAPAKALKEYADKFEKFNLVGGVMEGKVISLAEVISLASIPSREVLYGQIVCSLISPIASLAMVLNAICEKLTEQSVEAVAAITDIPAEAESTAEVPEAAVEATVETPVAEAAAEAPVAEAKAEAEPKAE